MSSLREHFQKVQAQKQAKRHKKEAQYLTETPPTGREQTQQPTSQIEVRFFNDWEQLSNIQSHEAKNAKKAELLPGYTSWIDGTIAGGVGTQNDMLLKLMVWALDVHDFVVATKIAEYALLNNMVMPEPFSRSVATIYAEQIADEGLKHIDNIADYADVYEQAVELTNSHDMPDEVRAKLYRAWGNSLKDTYPADAITAYQRAIKLNPKVGCRQDLQNLDKELNQET